MQGEKNKIILITGATGLIGSQLIRVLTQNGHKIHVLSRDPSKIEHVKAFKWNISKQEIDARCLDGVCTIIHLAGAGIADERWTKKRKKEIIDSRVQSIRLLYKTIAQTGVHPDTIISASGVGYYGNRGDEILNEDAGNGTGFLAESCKFWEDAVDEGKKLCERIVKLRIGIVLSLHGGALAELEKPVKYFVGAPLGTGKQWVPWIHLDDLLGIFETVIYNPSCAGPFNASSTFPVTNSEFTKVLAKKLGRPIWPLTVPAFVMKVILGEMSDVVLTSTRTYPKRLLENNFQFRYEELEKALDEIYSH